MQLYFNHFTANVNFTENERLNLLFLRSLAAIFFAEFDSSVVLVGETEKKHISMLRNDVLKQF